MSNRNDGGPAFPRDLPDIEARPDEALRIVRDHEGMSLRDYFAAKAMQSLLLRFNDETIRSHVASTAYEIADDMITEREK